MPDPKWKHDCKTCTYLGSYNDHDLYFEKQGGILSTVVARYGDHGFDYISGIGLARSGNVVRFSKLPGSNHVMALRIAYLIARDWGLVDRS